MYQTHHHSIFCVLPPHMLREIARNGTPAERDHALNTLAIDGTLRTCRTTYQLLSNNSKQAIMTAVPTQKQRTVYNATNSEDLPGNVVRSEGDDPAGDVAVDEAYDGLGKTFDFYLEAYSRNSIDDEGLHLDATVHYGQDFRNALWNGTQMVFGDGDGVIFDRFTKSIDVIGHELTHGVTGHEAKLIYLGQSGALNESISDVFGSLVKQYALGQTVDQADWLIGQGLFMPSVQGVALRSMKDPGTAYDDPKLGKDPQPANMSDYVDTSRDNGGVHINSGIPNKAFYLVATALGGKAWEKAGRIWYEALRDKQLSSSSSFTDFAIRTVINAGHLYGSGGDEKKAVVDAWGQVGITLPAGS